MSGWIMWPMVAFGFANSCVLSRSLWREWRARRAVPAGQENPNG